MQIISEERHLLIEPILGVERDPLRAFFMKGTVRPQRDRLPREHDPFRLFRRFRPTR